VSQSIRPGEVCKTLLAALEGAEGQRRKRKRDQTPDAIGLAVKRSLLERVVQDDPEPEAFEKWLLNYPLTCAAPEFAGSASAMARAVFEEWCLAHSLEDFKAWLDRGAPSEDVGDPNEKKSHSNVRETR
jgi:hypothetical protein